MKNHIRDKINLTFFEWKPQKSWVKIFNNWINKKTLNERLLTEKKTHEYYDCWKVKTNKIDNLSDEKNKKISSIHSSEKSCRIGKKKWRVVCSKKMISFLLSHHIPDRRHYHWQCLFVLYFDEQIIHSIND